MSVSAKKPAAKAKEKTAVSADNATKRKSSAVAKQPTQVMDARSNKDRRQGDRRQKDAPVEVERRSGPRRAKVNRRRQIDPTTCERDYSPAEVEFMSVWTTISAVAVGCSPHAARFWKSLCRWAMKNGPNCPASRSLQPRS